MKRGGKFAVIVALATAVVAIYRAIDPLSSQLFPKCPSLMLTGYRCAGCGTQTAIHHLLNFDLKGAFFANPLLVALLPLLVVMIWVDYFGGENKFVRLRAFVHSAPFGIALLVVLIIYTVVRNILNF